MEKIDLKGSLTEQNLLKAFAGESQAAARYRMYAKQARKDGFEKVACFFDETVHNEPVSYTHLTLPTTVPV